MGMGKKILAAAVVLALPMGLSACGRPSPRPEYGPEFVENMILRLTDPSDQMRYGAAHALGCMGADAKKSIPALLCCLDDRHPKVREEVAKALKKIEPATGAYAMELQKSRNTP